MSATRRSTGTVSQSLDLARFAVNIARPRQPLLLFSHMRSYSSLLCHILNSNEEIDGYGELGMSYESPLDLLTMRYRVAMTTGRMSRFLLKFGGDPDLVQAAA